MSILAFGGEAGFFIPSDASAIEATAALGGSGASYNSSFARCYSGALGQTAYWETPEVTAQTSEYWTTFDMDQSFPTNTTTLSTRLEILDSSGNARIRLLTNWQSSGATGTFQLEYWDGAAWVSAGSFSAAPSALQTVTIRVNGINSASGGVSLFLSGTQRIGSGTVDLSAVDDLAQMRFYGITAGIRGTGAYTQVVMANESTIGMRVGTLVATGQGTTHTFTTGGFANIDEAVYSDADLINSGTANQVELFTITPVPSFTGYVIRAICVTARAKQSGSGPTQIQLALRHGGTTYFSATQALGFGYEAHVNVWETDPGDAGSWLSSDIAALEIGVKSIA